MIAWRTVRGRSLGASLEAAYGDPTKKAKGSGKKGAVDDYAMPGLAGGDGGAGGMPFVFLDFDVRADTAAAERRA